MNETHRKRLEKRILRMVADLTSRDVKDTSIGFVTFTGVQMSSDGAVARVSVSVYGDDSEKKETLMALKRASGFYRSRIGKAIRLRNAPRIEFVLDDLLDRAERLDRLIDDAGDDVSDNSDNEGLPDSTNSPDATE